MVGFVRWLIVCGLILVGALSFGNITPAGKEYFTPTRDELLAAASDMSLPSGPTKADEPFLYFHIGPVRSDFFALSLAKTDAKQFAQIADEAIKKGFGTELDVKFAKERSMLVLDSDIDTSRWFLTSASRTVDLAAIREVFATKGMKPKILVRTSLYDEREGFPEKGKNRKRWTYYDGTTLGKVTVSELVGPVAWLMVIVCTIWVPLIVGLGIWLGILRSRDKNLSMEDRKNQFKKFAFGGLFVAFGLFFPLFFWSKFSGHLPALSDLWVSSRDLAAFIELFGTLNMFSLMFIGKWMDRYVVKLEGSANLAAFDADRRYENRIKLPGFILALVLASLGFIGFLVVINLYGEFRSAVLVLLIPVLIGLVMMGPIENHMRRITLREVVPSDETV